MVMLYYSNILEYINIVIIYIYFLYYIYIYIYIRKTEIVFFVVLIWINFFIPISALSFVNVIPR